MATSKRLPARDQTVVLRLLAARADLDAGVDAQLRNDNSALVRAAWMARPGRPLADIVELLEDESRQKVLEVVAATPDLPDEVYELVESRATGVRTLCALAIGPAPDDVRFAAAKKIIRLEEPSIPRQVAPRVLDVIRTDPHCRRLLLSCGGSEAMVRALWSEAGPEDLIGLEPSRLIEVLVKHPIERLNEAAGSIGSTTRLRVSEKMWFDLVDDIEMIEAYFPVSEEDADRTVELGNHLISEFSRLRPSNGVRTEDIADRLGRFLTRDSAPYARIAELVQAASEGGPDALEAVSAIVVLSRQKESMPAASKALAALASTSSLTPEVLTEVIGTWVGWRTAVRLVDLTSPETLELFASKALDQVAAASLVRHCPDPVAAVEALSRHMPGDVFRLRLVHRAFGDVLTANPQVLPSDVLSEPIRRHEWLAELAAAAMAFLLERFSADVEALAMVAELAPGAGTTIADVCEVVDAALGRHEDAPAA